jgi:UDP-GlcNAc:undecaprenyl-phosphate/decaprenyl-phosphate GlcNAc-1-phosphate transferase
MPGISMIIVCLACMSATWLLCYVARPLTAKLGLLDVPGERKFHARATPLLGGLALTLIIVPINVALVVFTLPSSLQPTLLLWLGCVAIIATLGMADDRHSLSANGRIAVSMLVFAGAAIIHPAFKVRILTFEYLPIAFGLITDWFAVVFTTICCAGLVNAVNMADGKNGLVIGLCIGWLAFLSLSLPVILLPLSLIMIASLCVLLLFNLKGLLFLGDGGSYGFSAAIALLTILIYNGAGPVPAGTISAEQIILLFCVPILDAFRLVFKRMRNGRSPMSPDRDHLHHHLQDRFGWPAGLVIYLLIAMLPSLLFWIFVSP